MVVTEKQILIMLRVLEGSLTVADRTDYNMFGYDREDRIRIYNEIINQQSDRMAEIKDTEKHISERDAAIRKECADRAAEKFWHELHEEAENQYDRRVELLGPVETAEDASYRKTLYDGWSAWLLAKRIVINRHAEIEGKENY